MGLVGLPRGFCHPSAVQCQLHIGDCLRTAPTAYVEIPVRRQPDHALCTLHSVHLSLLKEKVARELKNGPRNAASLLLGFRGRKLPGLVDDIGKMLSSMCGSGGQQNWLCYGG